MGNPNIKVKVIHSRSKFAWNIVGTVLGLKYKIARIPYIIDKRLPDELNRRAVDEAKEHADFIAKCFNHSDIICDILK